MSSGSPQHTPPTLLLCLPQGFGGAAAGGGATCFSLELPLPADSPAESASFAADILAQLPAAAVADAVVVCASKATAAAAGGALKGIRGVRVMSLQAACRSADSLTGPLVLLEPSVADVSHHLGVRG
jgi:hypothetical protein